MRLSIPWDVHYNLIYNSVVPYLSITDLLYKTVKL